MRNIVALTALLLAASVQASGPVSSAAADASAAAGEPVQTVTVWTVEMKGKPPFRRSREVLTVTDAAALEVATGHSANNSGKLKGRPPFNRHQPGLKP
ncbi:MAG: hypothetical protein ACK5HY_04410 [Parahaliea sp.]